MGWQRRCCPGGICRDGYVGPCGDVVQVARTSELTAHRVPETSLSARGDLLHPERWSGQFPSPHLAILRVLAVTDHPRRTASGGRAGVYRLVRQLHRSPFQEFEDARHGKSGVPMVYATDRRAQYIARRRSSSSCPRSQAFLSSMRRGIREPCCSGTTSSRVSWRASVSRSPCPERTRRGIRESCWWCPWRWISQS